jgi:hypothetical protein
METPSTMTDSELISRTLGLLDPGVNDMHALLRGNRVLLALPGDKESALRALNLYQPQRWLARAFVTVLKFLGRIGAHRLILQKLHIDAQTASACPLIEGIKPGTCGLLLGSPEHKVRRAIASYQRAGRWEVAKISFGDEGARLLERESSVLRALETKVAGVPPMLGLHRKGDVSVMRMPYFTGHSIAPGTSQEALKLLQQWTTDHPPRAISSFLEWSVIKLELLGSTQGSKALDLLSEAELRPVISHGDFARWNLLKPQNGEWVALDWEWGSECGMPGLDLVHYFLQDERLVRRLPPTQAILATIEHLKQPECRAYLEKTGWHQEFLLAIIASLAYKQGAGHQDNLEVLTAALALLH